MRLKRLLSVMHNCVLLMRSDVLLQDIFKVITVNNERINSEKEENIRFNLRLKHFSSSELCRCRTSKTSLMMLQMLHIQPLQ